MMLRQQLSVLKRQVKRPQLTNRDRIRLVLLARCTQFWRQALRLVQPYQAQSSLRRCGVVYTMPIPVVLICTEL